jgi:hypothetical protein
MMRGVLRRVAVAAVPGVDVSRVSTVPSAEMRGVTDVTVSAVPTVSSMTEVSQSSHRHRGEPGAAEREAETISVHTRYYASDAGW